MRARLASAIALAVALSGCSAPPLERYLRLDAVPVPLPAPAHPALAGDVQMLPFGARGLLAERHVVYLDATSGEASPAASLVWEDAPARSTARIVTEVLQAADVAPAVLAPDAQGLAEFWINGRIDRFELVVRPRVGQGGVGQGGVVQRAVVQLEFTLLAGRERRPALIARYCESAPSGGDPAHAFSQLVSAIAGRFAADLQARAVSVNAAVPGPAVLIGQRLLPGDGCDTDA